MIDYDRIQEQFEIDLLQNSKIYLSEEICFAIAKKIGKMLALLNAWAKEAIFLFIDCAGGSVRSGFDLYDIIKNSQAPVNGIVYRRANSMAIAVLQACKTRKMMAHSSLYFHRLKTEIELEANEDVSREAYQKGLERIKQHQYEYNKIIAVRSGLSIEKVGELCDAKQELTAGEALKLNLIDEII